jgi:hypothetical protein
MKETLRNLVPPSLLASLQRVRRRYWEISGTTSHWEVVNKLDSYYANSLNFYKFPDMAYECANDFPKLLDRLGSAFGAPREHERDLEMRTPDSFADKGLDPHELASLFKKQGSDKSTVHDYYHVYNWIFDALGRSRALRVLEIGLGTNNPGLVSTMGVAGVPGASLRAFRDFLPNAEIFGADIDREILFQEDRIRTAVVDQLKPASFEQMANALGCDDFDLVIDDGLHAPDANLNTLHFALSRMRIGCWAVIEDIPERSTPAWRVVARLLDPARFRCYLVRCRTHSMFVVSRIS